MEEKELHGHHDHEECGCEHDHHHEHPHDHEHEHHHHDECACGCEHDHEHHHHDHEEHEHHHEHEHEHHHHHEEDECECHDPNCTDPSHHHHHSHELVDIAHHESSIIGALKGVIPEGDYDKAEKRLAEQMKEAARRITEAGGIIGHIKFVLTGPGPCSQISVTDVDENIRRFDGTTCQVEGVAIVFAVEDDVLVKILTDTIGSILAKEE